MCAGVVPELTQVKVALKSSQSCPIIQLSFDTLVTVMVSSVHVLQRSARILDESHGHFFLLDHEK